jgi:hypothetical protein
MNYGATEWFKQAISAPLGLQNQMISYERGFDLI